MSKRSTSYVPDSERRLLKAILSADWSHGAERRWPDDLFRDIDWSRLRTLAWQHKIRPMLAATLRQAGWPGVPARSRAAIEDAERECSLKTMRQLELLGRIIAAAEQHGVRVIALKGVALSLYLYGDPFVREAYDLDLLIHTDDRQTFEALLLSLGCRPKTIEPPLSPRQTAILDHFHHDKAFVHENTGVVIESHFRLDKDPHLIRTDFNALWDRRSRVAFGAGGVAILGDDDLVQYLGLHASSHAWQRWKWMADLVTIFRRADPEKISAYRSWTARSGNQNLFDSWLLLMSELAHAPNAAKAASNRRAHVLAARALALSAPLLTPERLASGGYFFQSSLYRFAMKRSPSYLFYEFLVILHREKDWRSIRIPDYLEFLQYIIRPISYITRKIKFTQ